MNVYYILCGSKNKETAALNRVCLFVKGLGLNGVTSKIKIFDGYFCGNRIINGAIYFCKIIKFISSLLFLRKSILIFYGEVPFFRFFPLLKMKHKLIVERTEFSSHLITKDRVLSKKEILFSKKFERSLCHCHGFITCSQELSNYYKSFLNINCEIFISPLIVDIRFFDLELPIKNKISYCGDWGNQKDGVDILIKSFAKICKRNPDIRLELIGGSSFEIENSLKQLTQDLKISNYVDFVGRIPHSSMPNYLCSARLLALARPNNKQAEGGMPSKIAEYLSTSRPIVLTKVGELHYYLSDRINCYMSEADSVDSFAEKLEEALSDTQAETIGKKGHQVAKQFDIDVQSKLLIKYINEYVHI